MLGELQSFGREIVEAEVARVMGRLGPLTPEQQAAVEHLGRTIMQKLLHRPMANLRNASAQTMPTEMLAEALATLFELGPATPPTEVDAVNEVKVAQPTIAPEGTTG